MHHEVVPDERGDPMYTGRVLGPEEVKLMRQSLKNQRRS